MPRGEQKDPDPGHGGVLIVVSVEAEREAVLRGLGGGRDGAEVRIGGVGQAAAAARTARLLAEAGDRFRLVVSAGIGGGFPGRAAVGSLVVATEIVAGDFGAESPERFLSVDELGFGSARVPVEEELAGRVAEALQGAGLPAQAGPIVTVSTATGTAGTAEALAARVPGAAAEAMEGYGVAAAAREFGLPVLELRAISNAVGPRDREAWRIRDALDALAAASAILVSEVQR
ncbi:futalosine hydrolase [Paenibacillus sp. J31TS4]|uniref:futalosine hydrolase n=1 Tax=Paenibacillus sp. J31TS4 TaxID=2807195 RepID=UPI001BCE41E3|nr:futalosine hydrolase [Paenibacillus sp. J31TS4]